MFQNLKGMLALPEDPTKNAAARQGLIQAGAALMAGRGNLGEILGGGLMAGTQGYQGALHQRQQQQLMATQQRRWDLENKQTQAQLDEPGKISSMYEAAGFGRPTSAPSSMPAAGPTGSPAPAQAQSPVTLPPVASPEVMANYYRQRGDLAMNNGYAAQAKIEYERADKFARKLKAQEPRMVNGQRVMVNVFEDGTTQQVEGFSPDAEKLHFANTGGTTVAIDPHTGKPVNTIQNTQSPDSRASVEVQRRGQDMADARARTEAASKAPPGYRWTAGGELEAIPGGPASKAATSTEGERKAATLLMRMEGSERQLQEALKAGPSADKPGIVSSAIRGIGAETLANSMTGEARQRVEAAQLDILDSALTLGTGAAYTREQLEGYRKSYFPQIGDGPQTIADKQARLRNVIEAAKIAAGRSAPNAEAAVERNVKSVKDLPKKTAASAVPADIGNLLNKYGAK